MSAELNVYEEKAIDCISGFSLMLSETIEEIRNKDEPFGLNLLSLIMTVSVFQDRLDDILGEYSELLKDGAESVLKYKSIGNGERK